MRDNSLESRFSFGLLRSLFGRDAEVCPLIPVHLLINLPLMHSVIPLRSWSLPGDGKFRCTTLK